MSDNYKDYGELFCEAVDTIVQQRLDGIKFDSTILCTITDDSLRDKGEYSVSNGSAQFKAYSSLTNLRNNNNVYVQIPGGDWDQQKIIISKKTEKTNEPYIYEKPFDSLVDITGNLIPGYIEPNMTGLLANCPEDDKKAVTLWTYNLPLDGNALWENQGNAHSGYTRLGMRASFQSWLNPFYLITDDREQASIARYVVHGEYGLRLRLQTTGETTSDDDLNNEPGKVAYYDLYLNQADMNGNPYNFETYFPQEKVFDISNIGKISQIELQFYQTPGSFIDKDDVQIPFVDFLDNYIRPNLYVSEPYISLGYDINEFDKELVQIYTLDSTSYSKTADPLYNNNKKIQLRWIHKQDDGTFKSITNKDDINYELRWYRYELGHSSADEYSGVYWKKLSNQIDHDSFEIQDQDWLDYNTAETVDLNPSFFSTWCIPDVTLQEEQIKAIILYNGEVYRSNILICTNKDEVVSKPTVDAVSALQIVCDDSPEEPTYGNYRIYNQGNSLIDQAKANVERKFCPYFKGSLLTEAEIIEWIIPGNIVAGNVMASKKTTMIKLEPGMIGADYVGPDGARHGNIPDYYENIDGDGKYHIFRYGEGIRGNEWGDLGRQNQSYKIAPYYSQAYNNNTIQCKIVKDKTTYTAIKELTFGVAGTTGTDCTFILDFDKGKTCLKQGDNSAVTVTARLYDYENNEVDLSDRAITWEWEVNDGITKENTTSPTIELKWSGDINSSGRCNILKATLSSWGDYKLVAYLPIPTSINEYATDVVNNLKNIGYISGTTHVLYNSAGEVLDYFKNPYIVYNNDSTERPVNAVTWSVNSLNGEDAKYLPVIKTDSKTSEQYLVPLSFYIKDSCKQVYVTARQNGKIIWHQPLLIMSNKYPSAMVNKWDGSLDVGKTDPGTIMAPRLVAGKKNTDNTFSGVMLGDWKPTASDSSLTAGTGLYGYYHGEQSFGFREDGTAFIGKSGVGRIEFDGTSGIIQSAAYDAGKGMKIDLTNGTIDAHDFELNAGTYSSWQDNSIMMTTDTRKPYAFTIGRYFKVKWDGSIIVDNIDANSGYIGKWKITTEGFASEDGSVYLNANGYMLMGGKDSYNQIFIDGDGIDLGYGADRIRIQNGSIVIGKKSSIQHIELSGSGVQIGNEDDWTSINISSSGVVIGNKQYKPTIIDSESLITQKVYIYDNNGWSSKIGHMGYIIADYGPDHPDTGQPGIGIQVDKSVLKVTTVHVGLTNKKSTIVAGQTSASMGYAGGGAIYCNSEGVSTNAKMFTATGGITVPTGQKCIGIYATLA